MPEILGSPVPQDEYDFQVAHRNESRQATVIVLFSIFLGLSYLSLALRFWAQRIKGERFKLDDYAVVLATFFFTCNTIINISAVPLSGYALHMIAIAPEQLATVPYVSYAGNISYTLTWPMTKIAIVLLYLRIFPQRWFRRTCWFLMAILIIYIVGTLFTDIFQCIPVRKAFNSKVPGGCINYKYLVAITAIANVIIDCVIISIVQVPIWRLYISKRQRIGLSLIFSLGVLACAASIVRVVLAFDGFTPNSTQTYDGLWPIAGNIWASLELMLCLLCVNLPCCYPSIERLFRKPRSLLSSIIKSATSSRADSSPNSTKRSETQKSHDTQLRSSFTPYEKEAEITTGATSSDRRFDETPSVELGAHPGEIRVKNEIRQWEDDSSDSKSKEDVFGDDHRIKGQAL